MTSVEQFNLTENTNLVKPEEKRRVSLESAQKYRLHALVISWISVVVLSILGTISFALSVIVDSSAAFAFGFDAFLDTLSSLVVIWRYRGSDLYSPKRESVASIVLGFLFLISCGVITWNSISSLLLADTNPELDIKLYYIYVLDAVICSLLLIAKLYLGWKLESIVIFTDSINTGLETLMAIAGIAGQILLVKTNYSWAWLIDPVAALFSAVVLLLYGVAVIVHSTMSLRRETYESVRSTTPSDAESVVK